MVVDQAQVAGRQVDLGVLAGGAHGDVAHVAQGVAVDGVAADVEAVRTARSRRWGPRRGAARRPALVGRPSRVSVSVPARSSQSFCQPVRSSPQARPDGTGQVLEPGVAPRVVAEVGPETFDERVVAGVRAELAEHRLALLVGDRVEVRHRLGDVGHVAPDGVAGRAEVDAVALELAGREEAGPAVGEAGGADRGPAGGPRRERLVEPQVVPPLHGHQVAEPHVRHLVQEDLGDLAALVVGRGAAQQHAVAPGDAAPVLHGAAHVGHEDLVVLLLAERRPELLAEPGEALLGEQEQLGRVAVELGLERLAAVEPEVVAATLLAQLVEGAGVDDGDVGRQARGVLEGPEPPAVGEGVDRGVPRVAEHRPGLGSAHGEAVHGLEVGLVEVGPGAPGHVGLEAGPEVDVLVTGVDGALDAVGGAGVGLRRRHDQHVVGLQVGQRQPPALGGRGVERDAVQGRVADLGGAVDEGARAGRPAA